MTGRRQRKGRRVEFGHVDAKGEDGGLSEAEPEEEKQILTAKTNLMTCSHHRRIKTKARKKEKKRRVRTSPPRSLPSLPTHLRRPLVPHVPTLIDRSQDHNRQQPKRQPKENGQRQALEDRPPNSSEPIPGSTSFKNDVPLCPFKGEPQQHAPVVAQSTFLGFQFGRRGWLLGGVGGRRVVVVFVRRRLPERCGIRKMKNVRVDEGEGFDC